MISFASLGRTYQTRSPTRPPRISRMNNVTIRETLDGDYFAYRTQYPEYSISMTLKFITDFEKENAIIYFGLVQGDPITFIDEGNRSWTVRLVSNITMEDQRIPRGYLNLVFKGRPDA